ncbi:MAG TPA: phosphoribosyltransferase family protein [Candidatus Cryosericum sp.]|nr:phosphoribosyltransferase family protein [Candidatus Cryosericum sp.]HPS69972.1 phosphoribosyltransferase family protein [Candidatus Cryosericum sp.]
MVFLSREEAGTRLAQEIRSQGLVFDLCCGIPRGGVVVGSVVAQELGLPFGVLLIRKIRSQSDPELAIGALGYAGNGSFATILSPESARERRDRLDAEIGFEKERLVLYAELFEKYIPQTWERGARVLVVDDGIATGATMIAALDVVSGMGCIPTAGTPVVDCEVMRQLNDRGHRVVAVHAAQWLMAVGQFYQDFHEVTDREALSWANRAFRPRRIR